MESLEDQIHRAAYELGGHRTGTRVTLDRVRARFTGIPRAELDAALLALQQSGRGALMHNDGGIGSATGPTPAEQAAAIRVAFQPRHMLYLASAPSAPTRATARPPRAPSKRAKPSKPKPMRAAKKRATKKPPAASRVSSVRLSRAMAKMSKDCGRAVARLQKLQKPAKKKKGGRQGISRRKP